jgi:hypothetical protein
MSLVILKQVRDDEIFLAPSFAMIISSGMTVQSVTPYSLS